MDVEPVSHLAWAQGSSYVQVNVYRLFILERGLCNIPQYYCLVWEREGEGGGGRAVAFYVERIVSFAALLIFEVRPIYIG